MAPAKPAAQMTPREVAAYIDYAVLKPETCPEQVVAEARRGAELGCATICINPAYLDLCSPAVEGTATKLCPVTDFPFGCSSTASRVEQVRQASQSDLVAEVDIVINYGALKQGLDAEVTADLAACAAAAHEFGRELKVILETDALSEDEIRRGCECVIAAGADFIKTSTGFYTGGPTRGAAPDVVALIIEQAAGRAKVKGSGGIRDRARAEELIDLGVDRMGVNCVSVPKVCGYEE